MNEASSMNTSLGGSDQKFILRKEQEQVKSLGVGGIVQGSWGEPLSVKIRKKL